MIDWKKKALSLAGMIEARRPIKEIRSLARGMVELQELEQQDRDLFHAWHQCRGTREEREEAHQAYIEAIRIANRASELLDKLADG